MLRWLVDCEPEVLRDERCRLGDRDTVDVRDQRQHDAEGDGHVAGSGSGHRLKAQGRLTAQGLGLKD